MTTFPRGYNSRHAKSRNARIIRRLDAEEQDRLAEQERVAVDPGPRNLTVAIPRDRLLLTLISRDGDRCYLCGKTPYAYDVDHVMPRCHGGTDDLWNLALACPSCNRRKSSYIVAFIVKDQSVHLRLP